MAPVVSARAVVARLDPPFGRQRWIGAEIVGAATAAFVTLREMPSHPVRPAVFVAIRQRELPFFEQHVVEIERF